MPQDFDARRMALILAGFTRNHPHARLETISGMSLHLRQRLDAGDIDIALIKREPDSGPAWATWPERLVWVKSADFDSSSGVLPLAIAAGVGGVSAWGVGCGCRGICLTSSASVTGVY